MRILIVMIWVGMQANAYAQMTPADCREKCAAPGPNGWCQHLSRKSSGVGSTVDPINLLSSLAHTPQIFLDQQCRQSITIESSAFQIRGSDCRIEHQNIIGDTITLKVPHGSQGTISFSPQGESELTFSGAHPTFDFGRGNESPMLGENPIQFITEGAWLDGKPGVIWFDGYLCQSIERR